MTIGTPVARGTAVSGSNSSSLALTPNGTIVVDHAAIIAVEGDNPSSGAFVTSVTDTGGNTWDLLHEYINAAGVAVSVWRAHLTTQLTTGSTITINFGSTTTDKCAGLIDVPITAGNLLVNGPAPVDTPIAAAAGFGSAAFSALASLQRLYLRICGKEANSTTALTATTNFTNSGWAVRSRNNTNAQLLRAEWRVNTSTGETSNPTLAVTGDAASIFLGLVETLPTRDAVVNQTILDFTQTATGLVIVLRSAEVDQTIPSFTQTAGGETFVEGVASQTVPAFTQVATGTVVAVRSAEVDQTIPSFTQVTDGGGVASANVAQSFPAFTQTAAGEPVSQAAVNQALGGFAQTVGGEPIASASVAQTLGAFTQTVGGETFVAANADQTVATFGQTAEGETVTVGNVAQTILDFTQIAAGTVSEAIRFASVTQLLPAFGGASSGTLTSHAAAVVPLGDFEQVATGSVQIARESINPVVVIMAPVRLISRYDGQKLEGRTWGI